MFMLGITMSTNELKETLALANTDLNNVALNKQLTYRLGTALHWLIDYWERVEQRFGNLPREEASFFSALRYANNQLKHEFTLTRLYKRTGGMHFPFHFPLVFEAVLYVWSLESTGQTGHANQLNNYKLYLHDKKVIETIEEAIGILEKYEL